MSCVNMSVAFDKVLTLSHFYGKNQANDNIVDKMMTRMIFVMDGQNAKNKAIENQDMNDVKNVAVKVFTICQCV